MPKILDLRAYLALFCIKVALVREKTLLALIQTTKLKIDANDSFWQEQKKAA